MQTALWSNSKDERENDTSETESGKSPLLGEERWELPVKKTWMQVQNNSQVAIKLGFEQMGHHYIILP